jgi:hypothetical protein
MILIHINLCFHPTNWYVVIHINLYHKKEIESWRYLSPRWLSHCLSPSSRCATLLSCAVDCRCLHRRPVHRLPLLSFAPPMRCHCRRSLHAGTVALCAAALLPPPQPPSCCRAGAVALCGASAPPPPPSCRCCCCCRCRRSAVHWLVVAVLSTIQFCHRMPSCDCQQSNCQREHFCTNWYVLIWTTSILAINIDSTRTNCMNLYKH